MTETLSRAALAGIQFILGGLAIGPRGSL